MTTATKLYSALSMQMERKFNALLRITDLLDEEGIRYLIPHFLQPEVTIEIFSRNWDGIKFIIEPTLRGYKLIAKYKNWQQKIDVDFKVIERVYAETIVDNLQRIDENPNHYLNEYYQQKADWELRRKHLRRNQVIKELSAENTSA